MARKGKPNQKNRKKPRKQINFVPNCCQQPRSYAPKRRTDFSLFICSPSTSSSSSSSSSFLPGIRLSNRGLMLEISSCKDGFSSITAASMDKRSQASFHETYMPKFPLVQCSGPPNGRPEELISDSIRVPITEFEWVSQNELSKTCDNRDIRRHSSDTSAMLECTPIKSETTESNEVWVAPGSIVWAKTSCQMWWPAEIMGERSAPVSPSNQGVNGHILVQYYGNHKFAWVDPVEDLSRFENCFQEKSCNPMEAFQDALKQALHKKEHIGPYKPFDETPDGFKNLCQHDQSSDKWNSSSSSRTENDAVEGGRGKRKRKPKVHFDEVTLPVKSVKKVRRFRIMRHLGLMAPVGSPFSVTSHVRTAYNSCRILNF